MVIPIESFPSITEIGLILAIAVVHVIVVFKLAKAMDYEFNMNDKKPITLWTLHGMAIVGLVIGVAVILFGYLSPFITSSFMLFGAWHSEINNDVDGEPLGVVYMSFWIIPIVVIGVGIGLEILLQPFI